MRPYLGPDADDPGLVEVAEGLLALIGDVAGDLLRADLGLPRLALEFLDVDRGEDVLPHELLGDQDGVLEVVALPGHVGHQDVTPHGELALVGGRAVGQDLAGPDVVPDPDEGALVDARRLVGAAEFDQVVDVDVARRLALLLDTDDDPLGVALVDGAAALRDQENTRVAGGHAFHPGADERGHRLDQRDGLPLHVRTHEGAVGVVVLQEGDQGGRNRHQLLRRDVHVLDLAGGSGGELPGLPGRDSVGDELPLGVQLGVGLGDGVLVLLERRQVVDLLGHLPLLTTLR